MANYRDNTAPDAVAGGARAILSVSALNRRARQLLETHYGQVWVEGEISNLSRPSSGHWYFTLKDASAQLRCAMFRSQNQRLKFRLESGMKIIVRGRLSLYEARGDYQLIAEQLEESGIGALQRAYEQLKQKLEAKGWFKPENKQALPTLPAHIGVVTSPSGAAIHDIITTLRRRFPATAITVFPTAVQGGGAAAQIANAISNANALKRTLKPPLDALIVGRGGGSLDDLWAFNEEIVAAAIYASELPVVSAVGHETDFCIADFVADHRAPTPTAAAELLSPDQTQWLDKLRYLESKLIALLKRRIEQHAQQLAALSLRLQHPGARLREVSQRVDDAELRLTNAQQKILAQRLIALQNAQQRLYSHGPDRRLRTLEAALQYQAQQIQQQIRQRLNDKRHVLEKNMELLDSVSPLNTLRRGYAIVTDGNGQVLRSSEQVSNNDLLHLRLADGELDARVV